VADIQINPRTRDWEMDADGFLVSTNSLAQAGYIRLTAHFGEWMHDTTLGSTLFDLNAKAETTGESEVVRRAERALQPLIDDGRASSVTVKLLESTRYGRAIDVTIVDARSNEAVRFPFFVQVP
jgi:phage gp46-like protein